MYLIVSVVALIVVQVAIELLFGSLSRRGGTVGAGLEAVTLVVAPGTLTMLHPRTHTNPAKLEFTQFTIHMVATLVLFDTCIAFRTLLGIS